MTADKIFLLLTDFCDRITYRREELSFDVDGQRLAMLVRYLVDTTDGFQVELEATDSTYSWNKYCLYLYIDKFKIYAECSEETARFALRDEFDNMITTETVVEEKKVGKGKITFGTRRRAAYSLTDNLPLI